MWMLDKTSCSELRCPVFFPEMFHESWQRFVNTLALVTGTHISEPIFEKNHLLLYLYSPIQILKRNDEGWKRGLVMVIIKIMMYEKPTSIHLSGME